MLVATRGLVVSVISLQILICCSAPIVVCISLAYPRLIFMKRDTQDPMQLALNVPVRLGSFKNVLNHASFACPNVATEVQSFAPQIIPHSPITTHNIHKLMSLLQNCTDFNQYH